MGFLFCEMPVFIHLIVRFFSWDLDSLLLDITTLSVKYAASIFSFVLCSDVAKFLNNKIN